MMKWISSTDIVHWGDTRDCQGMLPELIRRLIRATTSSINKINFPSGENIQMGGWDGVLELAEGTEYLPQGLSVWEFGASKSVKGKADGDYQKRNTNALGVDKSKATYIFVTPRRWKASSDWIKKRKSERIWQDVRVIDAVQLEEWLEIAPAVALWLASEYLHKVPEEAIIATEHFWSEWAQGEDKLMIPELLLAGREEEARQLQSSYSCPALIALKSPSKEETLAFIIASFIGTDQARNFFARSVIVNNADSFRKLCAVRNPLILLPRFEDNSIFNAAVRQGHTVIVPLGIDDPYLWKSLDRYLPLIAEAAPVQFLSILEKNTKQTDWLKQILAVTKESYEFSPTVFFTGMLWGLEGLAWDQRYLSRVSLILLRMSLLSLPENVGNRPLNSLKNIFTLWCHQTFATFEERKEVLELMATIDPEMSWPLLVKLIPRDHDRRL